MAKKVKCMECTDMSCWATPRRINAKNYEYAKHCLNVIKRSFVCCSTGKVKPIGNEQYCKYFNRCAFDNSDRLEHDIKQLEQLIAEYEAEQKLESMKGE